jgi:hypothetical protein
VVSLGSHTWTPVVDVVDLVCCCVVDVVVCLLVVIVDNIVYCC